MSVRHFARVFTAEVGETPGRFVERVRVEAARRELETTDDTLDVIAGPLWFRHGRDAASRLPASARCRPRLLPTTLPRRRRRKDTRVSDTLQVVIPLFPRFTALDGVGPYEVLQRIPSHRRHLHRAPPGRGPKRERHARDHRGRHLRRLPRARHHRVPRRGGHPAPGARRPGARLGAPRPRHHPSHHVGVHRDPSSSEPPASSRVSPPPPTGRATPSSRPTARCPPPPVWSSTSIDGSSPPRACRAASTWPCAWWSSWSTGPRPRPPS